LLATIQTDDDFNAAIQAHSVDQFKEKGGEFGWLTEAAALQALNEEFKQTVFSLPKGKCGVVKSTYGLLIAKVADRTKDVEKFKIADITYTVTPSSATRSRTYNALNQFVVKNNTVELMEKSAKESGYEIVENARVVSTDMTLGAINNARQVVRWAFQSKKDNISEEIFECDNKFIVAANKGRLREGYQSVASATPQLKSELIARKKGEILAAELKSKNLSSLDAYAADFDAKVDTVRFVKFGEGRLMNIGNEPKLNALIAAAPLNKLSEPIAGSNGVYVFEVINRSFDGTAYDPKREISMLEMNNMYRIGSMALMTLQRKAEIKDNRINFY
jgi:peptidyl-prolyl cis-trans isomerase D